MPVLEWVVEQRLVALVQHRGGQAPKLKILGWVGWPDRMIILPGRSIFFVETKRPTGGVLRTRQRRVHEMLRQLGVRVYVVTNEKEIKAALES